MTETEAPFEARLLAEHGRLLALARALVHDADAQDVVQDVLATALARAERPRALGAWLRQVLRNEVRGRMRRQRQRDAHVLDIPTADAAKNQEDATAEAEMTNAVWEVLTEIDEPYHATVRRRFIDELSAEEIARVDGIASATVRWRIHEGLRRMRERLDARFDGRAQWCGGFAALVALPTQPVRGAAMSTFTVLKLAAVLAALGLAGAAAFHARLDGATQPDGTIANAGDPSSPVAAYALSIAPTPIAAVESSALQSVDPSEPAEIEANPRQLLRQAIIDCVEAAPERSLDGLERLELDLFVFGAEEGVVFHKVNVTTGRAAPEDDAEYESFGPVDAPGVIHHEQIRQCILESVDPLWLPTPPPFPGEYSGIGSDVVMLDGNGHVKRRQRPPTAPGDELPDVSSEPVVDPQRAAETFSLTVEGPADAIVHVVECGAYDCPFCKKSEATLAAVRARFPRLSIAWLEMPLSSHKALIAAKASIAAARQDRFWPFHRALFELEQPIDRAKVLELVDRLGLDRARFESDLDDPATARTIALQKQTCTRAGAFATPTFFVNGDMIRGELGVDEMMKTVTEIAALED